MESLWRLIESRIEKEDFATEKAYHFFGGAREWAVRELNLKSDSIVLDIGYGQGLFTIELASYLSEGKVVGLDMHIGRVTSGTARWFATQANVSDRIELIQSDATNIPFADGVFDAVTSFLGFQDIEISRGDDGVIQTIREMCRIAKDGSKIAIIDDCFPDCRPKGNQGKLFDSMRKYWHTLLPPVDKIKTTLEESDISNVIVDEFEPLEWLKPEDAERDLRLQAYWAQPQGIKVDFQRFWPEVEDIVRKEGRHYNKAILISGTKKD